MIILDRSYEDKKATLIFEISNGSPMTEEEALKYYENHLSEGLLTKCLLNVYAQSKIYGDISILDYETEEFYAEALDQEQKSVLWHALVEVEFFAYNNHGPFNNGE